MEKQIGKINFTKGHVTVTDPCYEKGTWCSAEVNDVFKGEWEASVNIMNCGDWGNRVASLTVKAVGQEVVKQERLEAEIGVDAGVCGVFEDKPDYPDEAWSDVCDELGYKNYGLASTSNAFHCVGAWSSSGYGDGGYTAIVGYNENAEVVKITIEYLTDEDEYDDEEDYEDSEEDIPEDDAEAFAM